MAPAIKCLIVLAIVALLFITELIPLAITAMSGAIACGLLGFIPAKQVFSGLSDSTVVLFAGMFVVGAAMFHTGLAQKIGISIVRFSGTSENTFSPDSPLTRGMFVTAFGRLAGINPEDYQNRAFTDVKADAYYAPYVNWAAKTGIVDGITSTTFAPDSNITREQMAVILKKLCRQDGLSHPENTGSCDPCR